VSERTVSKRLKEAGYSLQSRRKVHEGKAYPPNRDAQFQCIARQRESFQNAGQPTISVDTKKKTRRQLSSQRSSLAKDQGTDRAECR